MIFGHMPNSLQRAGGVLRSARIVLLLHGTEERPCTPASGRAVAALRPFGDAVRYHDVNAEPLLRSLALERSACEFFPQLYVDGEYMGGTPVIEEFVASGEILRIVPDCFPRLRTGEKAGECRRIRPHTSGSAVWCLAKSHNTHEVLAGRAYGGVEAVCLQSGRTQTRVLHDGWVTALVNTPWGETCISASSDATVRVWDRNAGTMRHELREHRRWINALAVDPELGLVVSSDAGGVACVWAYPDFELVARRQLYQSCTWALATSPHERVLITASADGSLRRWSLPDLELLDATLAHAPIVTTVKVTATGDCIVSAGYDGVVRCWSVDRLRQKWACRAHTARVWSVSIDISRSRVATVGADGQAIIRDLGGRPMHVIRFGFKPTVCLYTGEGLVVGGLNGEVVLAD